MIEDTTMGKLEKRMYLFVIRQLNGLNSGIQAGHCVEQYGFENTTLEYKDYVMNWKTWIILNGGTTNSDVESKWYGSLNQILDDLELNNINHAWFNEPDLNNALTSVCFLADERVFNLEKYPDWYRSNNYELMLRYPSPNDINDDGQTYDAWVEYIGGEKNLFLRDLIKDKHLARG